MMFRHVLLVDDNGIVIEVARAALEASGCLVTACRSPFHFAATLAEAQPDVALVDVLMPALGGDILVEIANRYRSPAARQCSLLLHSSLPESDLILLAKKCGADGYLTKGDPTDLFRRLTAALRNTPRRVAPPSQSAPPT